MIFRIQIRPMSDFTFAVLFILVLFTAIILVNIPACVNHISKNEARWEQTTRGQTQDIPSLKVSDGK